MLAILISLFFEASRCVPWEEGCLPRNNTEANFVPPVSPEPPGGRCNQPTDRCENKA